MITLSFSCFLFIFQNFWSNTVESLIVLCISQCMYYTNNGCLNVSFAVPLRRILCVYEVERAGDQELDVDIRMCCTEPEVQDPRQCRLHVLSLVRSQKHTNVKSVWTTGE